MIRLLVRLASLLYRAFLYGRSDSVKEIGSKVSDTNYPFY